MDLYFSVIKHRIYPIIPDSFSILLFQKLFQHNCACLSKEQQHGYVRSSCRKQRFQT